MTVWRRYNDQGNVIGGLITHEAEPSITLPLVVTLSVCEALRLGVPVSIELSLATTTGPEVYRFIRAPA